MKFVVTAGHSNIDPGAMAFGKKEADIAAELRNIIALKLRDKGHRVVTDGSGSENKSLAEAMKLIGSNFAIEIHCNASTNSDARGVESIGLPHKKIACQKLSKAIASVTGDKLRGDNGWIDQSQSARGKLGFVNNGGIIVEAFFISNKESLDIYEEKKWIIADAIANVMIEHGLLV